MNQINKSVNTSQYKQTENYKTEISQENNTETITGKNEVHTNVSEHGDSLDISEAAKKAFYSEKETAKEIKTAYINKPDNGNDFQSLQNDSNDKKANVSLQNKSSDKKAISSLQDNSANKKINSKLQDTTKNISKNNETEDISTSNLSSYTETELKELYLNGDITMIEYEQELEERHPIEITESL